MLRIEEATDNKAPTVEEKGGAPLTSSIPGESINANSQTPNQGIQDTGTLPGILRQQNDTINITDLGITLLQIELSENQRNIASTHTSTAFVISALNDSGPARQAQLTVGDIVIEIDGQEPTDTQSISRILKSYKPGSTVSLCILHGEELMNVDVQNHG